MAMRSQPLPRLHVIVGDAVVGAEDHWDRLWPVMEAGGGALALHLRTRATTARRLCEVACRLTDAAGATGTLIMVNDRLDVALATGAAGVHLREDSLPPALVREVAGPELLVGRSIHSPDAAASFGSADLDYLVLGAVCPTRSHPERAAIGIEAVAEAVAGSARSILAIGGITPEVVPAVLSRGAHGVVVLSGVWRAPNPQRAVTRYLEVLHESDGR